MANITLKNKFKQFVKINEDKDVNFQYKVIKFLSENKKLVNVATKSTDVLMSFAKNPSPFTLINGAITAFSSIYLDDLWYSSQFFSANNGWSELKVGMTNVGDIFEDVIVDMPHTSLVFRGTERGTSKVFKLPNGCEVGSIKTESNFYVYFRRNEIVKEDLLKFLVDEKISRINSKFFSLDYKKISYHTKISFIGERINAISSLKSKHFTKYITKYNDAGMGRAMIFYGPPGTGKTTLSQSIIKELNYTTLKLRLNHDSDLELHKFLIENFNIQAVVIDDFDQIGDCGRHLELFEYFNKKLKITIALVNSLKEFHSAILRPGRFDEIIKVDSLEEETINEILGDLTETYYSKVINWPVAYILELVKRSKFASAEELVPIFEDLNKRVESQMDSLKK